MFSEKKNHSFKFVFSILVIKEHSARMAGVWHYIQHLEVWY